MLEGAQGALPRLKSFMFCTTAMVQPYHKLNSSLPQGPCEPVAKDSQYFSTYSECKAETEHAIEQWVENNKHKSNLKVSIVRPGTVGGTTGIDGVTPGWTPTMAGLAGGMAFYV